MTPHAPAPRLEHRDDCEKPSPVTFRHKVTRHVITRCKTCGRFVDHETAPAVELEEPPADDDDATTRPRGMHRCSAHLEVPVTWRGTGCHACRKERDAGRKARAARKHAPKHPRREEDYTP